MTWTPPLASTTWSIAGPRSAFEVTDGGGGSVGLRFVGSGSALGGGGGGSTVSRNAATRSSTIVLPSEVSPAHAGANSYCPTKRLGIGFWSCALGLRRRPPGTLPHSPGSHGA